MFSMEQYMYNISQSRYNYNFKIELKLLFFDDKYNIGQSIFFYISRIIPKIFNNLVFFLIFSYIK